MRIYLIFLLALASVFVHAEQLDQCKELNDDINLYDEIELSEGELELCENNEEGKIDKLQLIDGFYDTERTKEEYENIQSYESITELTINSKYSSNSISYLTNLKNLKNLEKLKISYEDCTNSYNGDCIEPVYISMPKNLLKDLKSLKQLEIFGFKLSQDNIDEISALENLESLTVRVCDFEDVTDISSLNKLKKVTSLTYEGTPNYEFVKVFKSIQELEIGNIDSVADFPNLEKLKINGQLEDINSLEKCTNLKELSMNSYYYDDDISFSFLEKIPSIVDLDLIYDFKRYGVMTRYIQSFIDFKFSENSKIENMYLQGFNITEENINEILKLKSLKKMEIDDCTCNEELLDKLKEINGLCPLDISCDNVMGYGYCFMYIDRDSTTTTTDVEKETTTTVNLDEVPTAIGNSDEKLPDTDDSDEKLPDNDDSDEKLPDTDDSDEKLPDTDDSDEKLPDTDDSDEKLPDNDDSDEELTDICDTDEDFTGIIDSDEELIDTNDSDDEQTTTISGKCGEGYGKCKSGYCCSKYGWCGQSDEYCAISHGCQSEFGDCRTSKTTSFKIDNKYRCGAGIGSCQAGECCSKYGWCGKSVDHCSVSKGCQSDYGLCTKE